MELTKMDCSIMYTELESLQPLSPELFADEFVNNLNVGQLSRSEKAGKLLDNLDGLHREDIEPFDWLSNEKSIDISIFNNLSSSSSIKFENNNNAALKQGIRDYISPMNNCSHIKLEPDSCQEQSQLLQNNELMYNNMQSSTLGTFTVLDDSLYSDNNVTFPAKPIGNDLNKIEIASYPFDTSTEAYSMSDNQEWLKNEALTPPESPKDEDLLKMISEIEPDTLELLVLNNSTDEYRSIAGQETCDSSELVSECSSPSPSSVNDLEWSPPSSVNDTEWSPPSSVKPTRRIGGKASALKRKGILKPDIENRKLRKKEQNKSAATRYRLKKKAEFEETQKEEVKLAEKNAKLRSQFDDITREIRYLKSLMRDVYRKKGLIK